MRWRRQSLCFVFWLLLACQLPFSAQELGQLAAHEMDKVGKETADKVLDEEFRAKYAAEEKFYDKYATVDRDYFGWGSQAELKKPFNQLEDSAITSVHGTPVAPQLKNASNTQVLDALARQNQALAPPQRLKLQLNEHWVWPDTLDVSNSNGSQSATVKMSSLKDYISDAIDKLVFPPLPPGELNISPEEAQRIVNKYKLAHPAPSK